jgi:hypothetical protein
MISRFVLFIGDGIGGRFGVGITALCDCFVGVGVGVAILGNASRAAKLREASVGFVVCSLITPSDSGL